MSKTAKNMDITQFQFYKQLISLPYIDEIWLYGSRARGDHSEKSDIDLAIVAPRASSTDWNMVRSIIDTADTLLKVDSVHFDTLQDELLKSNIKRDKLILFRRSMTTQDKINEKLLILESAIARLTDACSLAPENRIVIDGTIQRFEFTFELFWKSLKYLLQSKGADVQFPKDVLKAAYQASLISESKVYIDMLFDRNESSQIYDLHNADRIYQQIKITYLPLLRHDFDTIKNQFFKK